MRNQSGDGLALALFLGLLLVGSVVLVQIILAVSDAR